MSHRCINAFLYGTTVYSGGQVVSDDHPILETHGAFFAKIDDLRVRSETASQGPGEVRTPTPAGDLEAWLAAEAKYEDDVQDWLAAEEQYQTDVATWLAAEATATVAAAPEAEKKTTTRTRARH